MESCQGKDDSARVYADHWLALVLFLSLTLKVVLSAALSGLPLRNDEREYVQLARGLVSKSEYPTTFRPPLYPAFIAGVMSLGGDLQAVRLLQGILSTLTVLLVYRVARQTFGTKTARLAAALFAFDPVMVAFSHFLWVETVFVLLIWCMLDLLLCSSARPMPLWRPLGAGVALGAAGLTRPVILTFAPIVALWMIWILVDRPTVTGSRGWKQLVMGGAVARSLVLALGACAVVLPWTARNYSKTGAFILVDSNGPINLLIATAPGSAFVDKDDCFDDQWINIGRRSYRRLHRQDPGEAQRVAVKFAKDRISHDPVRYLARSVWEGAHLLTLDSFLLRHLRNDWYRADTPLWLTRTVVAISVPLTALLLCLGLVGLLAMPASGFRSIATLAVIHSVIFFSLVFSLSRYQVPLRALLAIAAAWALVHSGALPSALQRGRAQRAGAVLVVLILLAAWYRDLPLVADMLRTGGTHHRFEVIQKAQPHEPLQAPRISE